MTHYYRKGYSGRKILIPLTIRGVTLEFVSYTSLFSGKEVDKGTYLLLKYMDIPDNGEVLDVGCGYGVIGLTIAKLNPRLKVYMVDINPLAVKITKYNAKLNNLEKQVSVLQGDAYEPFKNLRFNAIYSNPPLSSGMSTVEKIVLGAINYLKPDGFAEFVLARGGEYLVEKARGIYSYAKSIRKKGYIILKLKP
ncbi:class I SAM-dependent methyltransferase [Staphylothermus hellenicus]|uniref:Methyltransferase small n=1 Tax=Staphylothermus hellenicus (strain DSM 12710 / JCM 10830 / BK20S6-10-b1 / P8) TaxID=591019 RepID=D7D9Q7_STAHD|nr:methyltransferase [Staphylothermus hellenicus]ADI32503.1 methyltransferase small [Staphylothermus hellenicus DSM 12710]